MRKCLAVVLAVGCLILAPSPARAVRGGLAGGVAYSSIDRGSRAAGYSLGWRWRAGGGVVAEIALRPGLRLAPALLYREQGAETEFAGIPMTENGEILERVLALDLPIERVVAGRGFVSAGPEIDYLLSGVLTGTVVQESAPASGYRADYTSLASRVDLLLRGGIGWEILTRSPAVAVEASYAQGITSRRRAIGSLPANELPWMASGLDVYRQSACVTRRFELRLRSLW